MIDPLHAVGTLVLADVASMRHVHRALEAGADGLILLTAGSGGQTGWANPFAFVRAVREIFDGPVVLAGGISDGASLVAAQALGADLGYMGTRFLATTESRASDKHKEMVAQANLDDVVLTSQLTRLPTSMLGPSLASLGLDVRALRAGEMSEAEIGEKLADAHIWRDLFSGGHSVSGVHDVPSVVEVVERLAAEYHASRRELCQVAR